MSAYSTCPSYPPLAPALGDWQCAHHATRRPSDESLILIRTQTQRGPDGFFAKWAHCCPFGRNEVPVNELQGSTSQCQDVFIMKPFSLLLSTITLVFHPRLQRCDSTGQDGVAPHLPFSLLPDQFLRPVDSLDSL
jgi:hypothetical protein